MSGILDHLLGRLNGHGDTIRARKPEPFADETAGDFEIGEALGVERDSPSPAADNDGGRAARLTPVSRPAELPLTAEAIDPPEERGASASQGEDAKAMTAARKNAADPGADERGDRRRNGESDPAAPMKRISPDFDALASPEGGIRELHSRREDRVDKPRNGPAARGEEAAQPLPRHRSEAATGRETEPEAAPDSPDTPRAVPHHLDGVIGTEPRGPLITRPAAEDRIASQHRPARPETRSDEHESEIRQEPPAPLRIEIGRVEIHAPGSAAPVSPQRSRSARRSAAIDLDRYLADRSGKS
ncbi:MAG: hypothetical protein V2I82_11555 [Halieaceae bacterium]|jgi:hypothetical protein|nr:hypothetical protein [Halieaceae bacterium]